MRKGRNGVEEHSLKLFLGKLLVTGVATLCVSVVSRAAECHVKLTELVRGDLRLLIWGAAEWSTCVLIVEGKGAVVPGDLGWGGYPGCG